MSLAEVSPLPSLHRRRASEALNPNIMILFMVCLALPLIVQIASLRLSPYRLVLLAMFLPCVFGWLCGRAGPVRLGDILILGLAGWCAISLFLRHGVADGIEAAGIVFVETLTPYLLARLCIRDLASFQAMVRALIWIVIGLLPFAIVETLTGWNAILDGLGKILPTYSDVPKPSRMGLDRVQGPFEHPILFGVFCGPALALGYYTLKRRSRLLRTFTVSATAALSLSSGPLTALIAQAGMVLWDRMLGRFAGRWILLGGLSAAAYVLVDVISNRTPAEVFISYAAFNSETAYNRLLIWEWGWVNIWQNPFFGIGNDDWQRLWHMTSSFDMFWLHRAMVHGLPAGLLNLGLFFWLLISLVRLKSLSQPEANCRTGLVISMIGFFVAGMTVHFWNATFVWLMFLLGSGIWLMDRQFGDPLQSDEADSEPRPTSVPKGLLAVR